MKKHFLRFTVCVFCFILFSSCAATAQVAPPKEENKREADLLELVKLDKTIKLDIRYARTDNFVGKVVYPEARAFLQRPAAEAVLRVHEKLKKQGLGLVIFDGYRPWSITKLFWEVVREDQRKFVANPANGSKHNRGCAVDLSIYDLQTGKLTEMPSDFDEFTERASPDYAGGTDKERANRDLLRRLMEAEGFTVNANEWWHFDYKDWQEYAIYDIPFSAIGDFKARFADAKIEENKDWKKFFDAEKAKGGIVVYDLRQNKFTVYDRERMNKGFVPASTSKIIHSLIFLDSGAVKDETEVFKWDGVKRFSPDWNKDHNLRTAFQTSAAWFYVEASKRLGREKMQKYYDAVGYGNRKTDGFGEAYWVNGDLRITPREQVELLVRLYENSLPFAQRSIELVKEIMIAEKTDKYVLRAKTGWSDTFKPQVGWWVGYVEREQNAYFFALEMDMKNFADAEKRKTVTKNILKSLQIIE
nr:ClassD_beta_lactamase [uncultured bacterium]AIA11998.1 ClassD_beta_lactamase [uncultured bacterium]AIA12065.1 ClassD_beta_lactamase [uncultured bacterium]